MIIEKNYNELQKSNMEKFYNESLNHRAIPETRDGLMEVQRKILWTMFEHKYFHNKKHVKCAKINGLVLTYYVHGVASAYDALVNMGQEWKNQIPLTEFEGNYGTVFGDEQAADRYLEGRLTEDAQEIFMTELSEDCVDMVDNYDLTEKEPYLLNSRIPIYLINGTFGIAAGYSISVPTHNPVEVITETQKLLKDPNAKIQLYPDFPTGGYICKSKYLDEAYSKGRGKVVCRGKIIKDEKKHQLIITEVPYMKSLDSIKSDIKSAIQETKNNKTKKVEPPKILGVKKLADESSEKKGIRYVITVKPDYPLDKVEKMIYKYSGMETTVSIILLGTENRKFTIHNNVEEVLLRWIDYRRSTIKRIKLAAIKKYKLRMHIVEGLIKILENDIDSVIAMIKKSNNKNEIITNLINDYNLSDIQARYVADLNLYKLSGFGLSDLKKELSDLTKKVDEQIIYFKDNNLIDKLINDDLEYFKKKYAHKTRKTVILDSFDSIDDDIEIEDTEHTLVVTKKGYIKKLPIINSQKRNGKGINVGKLKENDYPVYVNQVSNKDYLLIFTSIGKVYKYPIYELNEGTTNTLGNLISGSINGENITSCINISNKIDKSKYGILLATKLNKIKITPFEEFNNINKGGIIATKLNESDEIISANLIELEKDNEVLISNSAGNTIKINSSDIPVIGRTTFGSLAMHNSVIKNDVEIVSISIKEDTDDKVFVITNKGNGKLIDMDEFSISKRGTKGVLCTKLKENDQLCKAVFCNKNQEVTIVSNLSLIKINTSELNTLKRPTFGVSLKNTVENERIIDISLI